MLILLVLGAFGHSQSSTDLPSNMEAKHELKINGLFLILGAAEVDYQYLLNTESAIGIDVLYAFDDANMDINFHISPYYRQYFGKKYASGFFVEGFGMLNSISDFTTNPTSVDPLTLTVIGIGGVQEDVLDLALGLGVGVKFLTTRNFVFEIDLGIARNIFRNDRDLTIIGKGGIHVGYRF